ncbi:MAG: DUF3841 domain-containing protein [Lachnospiraceae bacterium]|nr:DUF3841 domain-containing protein [Lachnospiraceae bacterium]
MTETEMDVILYTAQQPVVLEALERDGRSVVRREYIDKKYGDTSWVFQEAYSFFRQTASTMLPKPEDAESPVWLFADSRWCFMGPDSVLMTFQIPRQQVLFFDQRVWNRILNLEYLGKNEKDEEGFSRELKNIGLSNTHKLFSTSFYPMQKRKVRDSWKKLFTSAEGCPEEYLQAAVWELKKEWLLEVRNG